MTGQEIALILSRHGQTKLAEAVGVSTAEISRKLTSQPDHGWSLEQLAMGLDSVGARIVMPETDMVTIKRDELTALNLLAARYLNRRVTREEGREP